MTERLRALITKGRSVADMDQILATVDKANPLAVAIYCDGKCPKCGGHDFNPGPHGGLSENIRCAGCGAKWWIGLPFPPEPLQNTDQVYDGTRTFDLRAYFRGEGEA